MKKDLKSMAMRLSEDDIQELMRLKKTGSKQVVAMRKKRDKLAAEVARLDRQLADILGEVPPAAARRGRRPGSKNKTAPARKSAAEKKKPGRKPGRKSGRNNLSAAVREIFAKAGEPLKASQVVDALPDSGIKVPDVAAMRKRISVVLASQKNRFEQVERGVYRLREE